MLDLLAPALAGGFADSRPLQILAPQMADSQFEPIKWHVRTSRISIRPISCPASRAALPPMVAAQLMRLHGNQELQHDPATLVQLYRETLDIRRSPPICPCSSPSCHCSSARPGGRSTAGFDGVEIQFPYEVPAIRLKEAPGRAGMPLVLINLPAGDLMTGGPGLAAVPARQAEFSMRRCRRR